MNIFTTPTLYKGGTVVLDDVFNPVSVLEKVEQEKVTTLFLVPAMWLAVTQVPNFETYDLSSLRLNISGGSPCPVTVIEFFQCKGITFIEGFGLTESAQFVVVVVSTNCVCKTGLVGKTIMWFVTRILDS